MKAILISIGNEILIGQIQDTNSQYITKKLDEIGVEVVEIRVISDSENNIKRAFAESLEKADIVISTGGLGPTKDDMTKNALADFLNSPLVYSETIFEHIKLLFSKIGRVPNDLNKNQALHPLITEPLQNDVGTAPGLWTDINNKVVINLPGVPHEMKYLMEKYILPKIKSKYTLPFIIHKTFLTINVPESDLSSHLENFEKNLSKDTSLAYLPAVGKVRLRLSVKNPSKKIAEAISEKETHTLKKILGNYLYSSEEDQISVLILNLLKDRKYTLSIAESCTGGALSKEITSVSGSSAYFLGSIVAYQSNVKQSLLAVPQETIQKYTVVSTQVAEAMARGVQKKMKSKVACSTTGVAGPNKGEDSKEVGTLCYAIIIENSIFSKEVKFPNLNREQFIKWSVNKVLQDLYLALFHNSSHTR